MRRRTIVTTGDVAEHCQVSYETVKNWIRQDKLPAFETPGGHHRILIENFKKFLASYGMPPYEVVPEAPEPEDRKRKVLIVDDDVTLVTTLVDFCTKVAGYECASASDGFEAGMQVVSFEPDLVILDIFMPHMNGFEVCETIKSSSETKDILVLVITGHPEDGNMSNIYACGADDCLVKPFKLEELKQRMERLFAKRAPDGASQPEAMKG